MAVELNALKMYWAYSLTGMHDLAMRQIIDGADALVSITSGPTKVEVRNLPDMSLLSWHYDTAVALRSHLPHK